jgi:hypothetical protein
VKLGPVGQHNAHNRILHPRRLGSAKSAFNVDMSKIMRPSDHFPIPALSRYSATVVTASSQPRVVSGDAPPPPHCKLIRAFSSCARYKVTEKLRLAAKDRPFPLF